MGPPVVGTLSVLTGWDTACALVPGTGQPDEEQAQAKAFRARGEAERQAGYPETSSSMPGPQPLVRGTEATLAIPAETCGPEVWREPRGWQGTWQQAPLARPGAAQLLVDATQRAPDSLGGDWAYAALGSRVPPLYLHTVMAGVDPSPRGLHQLQ